MGEHCKKKPGLGYLYAPSPSAKSPFQGTLTSTFVGSLTPSHLSVGPGRKLWFFSKPALSSGFMWDMLFLCLLLTSRKEPMVNLSHPAEADLWVSQPPSPSHLLKLIVRAKCKWKSTGLIMNGAHYSQQHCLRRFIKKHYNQSPGHSSLFQWMRKSKQTRRDLPMKKQAQWLETTSGFYLPEL